MYVTGYYYKLAGERELQTFLQRPEEFVPPLAPTALPPDDQLPKRVTAEMVKQKFPQQVELMGYCPVTYADGKFRCDFFQLEFSRSDIRTMN